MPTSPPKIHVSIASRYEDIDLVDLVTEASLRHAGIDETSVDRVSLAVREAVANGVKHGNQLDESKHVEVSFQLASDEVTIQVSDEGTGFDRGGVLDPLAPENLLRPSGRGLLLMEKLVDTVDFHRTRQGSTVVTLRKKIQENAGPNEPEESH